MTDTSSLSHLIERLEKATGPDGDLDNEIYWAASEWINEGGWWRRHRVTGARERYTYYPAPQYTSSIDAAMTLVPKGWSRHLSEDDKNIWWVELRRGHATSYDSVIITKNQSLAIALCLASLKAQLSTRTNEQDDARNLSGVSSE